MLVLIIFYLLFIQASSSPSKSSDINGPCNCESWLSSKLVELPSLGYMMPQVYDYGCGMSLFCRWDGNQKYDRVGIQTIVEGKKLQTYLFNGTAPSSWDLDKDFGVQCDEKSKKWIATQFPDSYKPTFGNLPFSSEQKINKVFCYPKM